MFSSPVRLALLLLLLFNTACSVYSVPGQRPAPVEQPAPVVGGDITDATPATPVDTGTSSTATHSSAYQSLLSKAENAADRGDYAGALALLERAHRLDPDSAEIYLAMARVHCEKGDQQQCRAVAERGLLYCEGAEQCSALRRLSAG